MLCLPLIKKGLTLLRLVLKTDCSSLDVSFLLGLTLFPIIIGTDSVEGKQLLHKI